MLVQIISLLAAIAYSFSFILAKRGLPYSTPMTMTVVSLIVHTLALWSMVLVVTGIPRVASLSVGLFVIAGILQFPIRQLTYIGIDKIGAALSGPLRATVPLWSAMLAVLFLGERMTFEIIAGTLLVFAGIIFISWRADRTIKNFQPRFLVFPLVAAVLGGVVYPIRRYALMLSNEPVFFAALVGTVALATVLMYLALPTTQDRIIWNRQSAPYFVVGGAFEALGLLLVLYALSSGPVVIVAPISSTLPLWVVIGSKLFLRDLEKITTRIVIGATLVVIGTVAISLSKP
jgi:DME family drug/metabolite transporter